MTTPANPELHGRTVGDIAATLPGATAVFRKYNVDFCCHGDVALADAARQQGVNMTELENALQNLETADTSPVSSFDTSELIDHILTRYHETHRRELTELVELAETVESVHAAHPQAPKGLADLLRVMRGELEVHMKKEELILFPAMRREPAVDLSAPIAQMRRDHDDHAGHLRQIETLTSGFSLPAEACSSWQALYKGTAKLTEDLMEHVHLENNVLFPRFQGTPAP